jgi:DNA-binding Lrp family transcriptional regulator
MPLVFDLDEIDKGIILMLLGNCRTSYQTLARRLNMTSNAVKKRVKKLMDTGIIQGFTVELGLAMIGGENFVALIYTDGSEKPDEFLQGMGSNPLPRDVGALSGAMYIAIGSSEGPQSIADLGSFLRKFKNVKNVELHTLADYPGKRVEFTGMQFRVLRCLVEDPRMSLQDISKRTGLTARRTSAVLRELIQSEALTLTIRWNLNIGDSFAFLSKITWDDKATTIDQITNWLSETFPVEYWAPMISANEPVIFGIFVVRTFRDADRISNAIAESPLVKAAVTLFGKPPVLFPGIRRIRLEQMLKEAGV